MIYRIGHTENGPFINTNWHISFGKWPFFGDPDIKPYSDVWENPAIEFVDDKNKKTDEYPDLTEKGGKLFLSEKAYSTLKETLTGHGEFLPVTFTGGTGFIFNPLEDISPIESSVIAGERGSPLPAAYQFNENNLPPIFKTEIDNSRVFITKDVYRMIRLNGLNGLLFYKDYSNTYAEPEGGYKGSISMPGYENED